MRVTFVLKGCTRAGRRPARTDRARAVFVLHSQDGSADAPAFESQLLRDADVVRQRIVAHLPDGP